MKFVHVRSERGGKGRGRGHEKTKNRLVAHGRSLCLRFFDKKRDRVNNREARVER